MAEVSFAWISNATFSRVTISRLVPPKDLDSSHGPRSRSHNKNYQTTFVKGTFSNNRIPIKQMRCGILYGPFGGDSTKGPLCVEVHRIADRSAEKTDWYPGQNALRETCPKSG